VEHEFFTTEADILRDLFGETPRATALIIDYEEKIAGITIFFYNFASFIGTSGLYIEDIYIRREFQGKGLGTQVFTYLKEKARLEGCRLLEWQVLDDNAQANAFYQKMGAEPATGWVVNRIKF
jgi:GNAT superfamily N-acetyltransferase